MGHGIRDTGHGSRITGSGTGSGSGLHNLDSRGRECPHGCPPLPLRLAPLRPRPVHGRLSRGHGPGARRGRSRSHARAGWRGGDGGRLRLGLREPGRGGGPLEPGPQRPPQRGPARGGRGRASRRWTRSRRSCRSIAGSTRRWPASTSRGEDAATRYLVEKSLRDFRRAGVDRDDATRAPRQGAAGRAGQDRAGVRPEHQGRRAPVAVGAGRPGRAPRGLRARAPAGPDGKVAITTDNTDYVPFVTYARSERAREELWRLYRQRGHPSNLDVLGRLLERRAELARLLGYPSWAAYVTEDKMIGSAGGRGRVRRADRRRRRGAHAPRLRPAAGAQAPRRAGRPSGSSPGTRPTSRSGSRPSSTTSTRSRSGPTSSTDG